MQEILNYCDQLPEVKFESGDVILGEGSQSNVLYVLIEGTAEVAKGDIQITSINEPGAVFGEISVLLGVPHMATVRAVTATRFYRVDNPEAFLRSQPDACYEIARLMAQRVTSVTNYLADIKEQYRDRDDHFGIIDEVLDTLVHQQGEDPTPGSDRDPV